VTPDIKYDLMPLDLRSGFVVYKKAILKALSGIIAADQSRQDDPARKAIAAKFAQAKADIQARLGFYDSGELRAEFTLDGQSLSVEVSYAGQKLDDPALLAQLVAAGKITKAQLDKFLTGLKPAATLYARAMLAAQAEYEKALQAL
jgi:hypothetical protein